MFYNDEIVGGAGIGEEGNKDSQLLIIINQGFFLFKLEQNCLEVPGEFQSSTRHLKDLDLGLRYFHCLSEFPKLSYFLS